MKKIELHLHLDGSLRVETVSEILNVSYNDAYNHMVSKNSKSLNDYLEKFDYPIKAMQTYEKLYRVSKELVEDLIKDDVIYAEVRFAPIFHTSILDLKDVCKAVLEGLKSDKIEINLILCMMRNSSYEDNLKIIDLFDLDDRIVGLDLAGAENMYPNELFIDLFEIINSKNIPLTIHSGEEGNPNNVLSAIKYAKRIGHGIASIKDSNVIDKLIENDILLEVCPTSNMDTFAITNYNNHPIYELYKKGVKVCINTDDRTVSNITLNEEYDKLKKAFNFSDEDYFKMNMNAINSSFATEKQKEKIRKIMMI